MNATPWRRTVECLDVTGRDRELVLALSDNGRLTLRTPPGELALVHLLSGGDVLKSLITEAQHEAANRALGQPASVPVAAGQLREAQTFYVLDAHHQVHPLGVGLNGLNVAVSGPAKWWQADDVVAAAIGSKVLELAQTARGQRRLRRS